MEKSATGGGASEHKDREAGSTADSMSVETLGVPRLGGMGAGAPSGASAASAAPGPLLAAPARAPVHVRDRAYRAAADVASDLDRAASSTSRSPLAATFTAVFVKYDPIRHVGVSAWWQRAHAARAARLREAYLKDVAETAASNTVFAEKRQELYKEVAKTDPDNAAQIARERYPRLPHPTKADGRFPVAPTWLVSTVVEGQVQVAGVGFTRQVANSPYGHGEVLPPPNEGASIKDRDPNQIKLKLPFGIAYVDRRTRWRAQGRSAVQEVTLSDAAMRIAWQSPGFTHKHAESCIRERILLYLDRVCLQSSPPRAMRAASDLHEGAVVSFDTHQDTDYNSLVNAKPEPLPFPGETEARHSHVFPLYSSGADRDVSSTALLLALVTSRPLYATAAKVLQCFAGAAADAMRSPAPLEALCGVAASLDHCCMEPAKAGTAFGELTAVAAPALDGNTLIPVPPRNAHAYYFGGSCEASRAKGKGNHTPDRATELGVAAAACVYCEACTLCAAGHVHKRSRDVDVSTADAQRALQTAALASECPAGVPTLDADPGSLFSFVEPTGVLAIFNALILEKNIVFVSSYPERLTPAIATARALMYPATPCGHRFTLPPKRRVLDYLESPTAENTVVGEVRQRLEEQVGEAFPSIDEAAPGAAKRHLARQWLQYAVRSVGTETRSKVVFVDLDFNTVVWAHALRPNDDVRLPLHLTTRLYRILRSYAVTAPWCDAAGPRLSSERRRASAAPERSWHSQAGASVEAGAEESDESFADDVLALARPDFSSTSVSADCDADQRIFGLRDAERAAREEADTHGAAGRSGGGGASGSGGTRAKRLASSVSGVRVSARRGGSTLMSALRGMAGQDDTECMEGKSGTPAVALPVIAPAPWELPAGSPPEEWLWASASSINKLRSKAPRVAVGHLRRRFASVLAQMLASARVWAGVTVVREVYEVAPSATRTMSIVDVPATADDTIGHTEYGASIVRRSPYPHLEVKCQFRYKELCSAIEQAAAERPYNADLAALVKRLPNKSLLKAAPQVKRRRAEVFYRDVLPALVACDGAMSNDRVRDVLGLPARSEGLVNNKESFLDDVPEGCRGIASMWVDSNILWLDRLCNSEDFAFVPGSHAESHAPVGPTYEGPSRSSLFHVLTGQVAANEAQRAEHLRTDLCCVVRVASVDQVAQAYAQRRKEPLRSPTAAETGASTDSKSDKLPLYWMRVKRVDSNPDDAAAGRTVHFYKLHNESQRARFVSATREATTAAKDKETVILDSLCSEHNETVGLRMTLGSGQVTIDAVHGNDDASLFGLHYGIRLAAKTGTVASVFFVDGSGDDSSLPDCWAIQTRFQGCSVDRVPSVHTTDQPVLRVAWRFVLQHLAARTRSSTYAEELAGLVSNNHLWPGTSRDLPAAGAGAAAAARGARPGGSAAASVAAEDIADELSDFELEVLERRVALKRSTVARLAAAQAEEQRQLERAEAELSRRQAETFARLTSQTAAGTGAAWSGN